MANNRLFLIHRPTRLGIQLGKRFGWGWYRSPDQEELDRFYNYLSNNPKGSQDDFILAMEDCGESSCFGDFQYTKEEIDGFMVFELNEHG